MSGVPVVAQWLTHLTRNHELRVRSLALLSGLRLWCCHELWYRSQRGSDLALLWLWHRLAATALIRPLAKERERISQKSKKLKEYSNTKPILKEILKGLL